MAARRSRGPSTTIAPHALSQTGESETPGGEKTSAGGTDRTKLERPMLLRSLKLLEAVAAAGQGISLTDLAQSLHVPKPTVFRLTQRLEEGGYLLREPGKGGFTVGPRLLSLGFDTIRASGTNPERRAILGALVAAIGETCHFTALAGSEVLYLDRVETRWPLRAQFDPGLRLPLHSTASGKLFLAHMPAERRRRLLEMLDLTAATSATLTTPERLEEECSGIRRDGYSLDREEFMAGVVSIAVPVTNSSGGVMAAIACHAPSVRLTVEEALGRLPRMHEAARKLSETLAG